MMPHFALRVGDLFHFHPFALHPGSLSKTRAGSAPADIGLELHRIGSDALAFFGLCQESHSQDSHADLEHLALMKQDGEALEGLDETILFLP